MGSQASLPCRSTVPLAANPVMCYNRTPHKRKVSAVSSFGFEEQYAMFDVTPVDNQFILDYLPGAKGDDVRVYLYGLMQCHHPQEDMTVERMARELGMTAEDVEAAYRRWERKGLVQRISDHPPRYRYVSAIWKFFRGGEQKPDERYERFAEALNGVFGNERRLHGGETSLCFEWVEELRLPEAVVIRLMEHMVALHGKSVSIKSAEKLAAQLAEEKVTSVEDADVILSRDEAVWKGAKQVLRRMGKRRNPSEDEQGYYRTWLVDWGFAPEAILAACAETVSGDPNFKYLNGILARHHQQYEGKQTSGKQMEKRIRAEKDADVPLKALLSTMNLRGVTVNDGTRAVYAEMRALYPDNIILMAGQECARHGLAFDDVMKTLTVWKKKGLVTAENVAADIRQVNEQNAFVQTLFDLWGVAKRPNASDRALVQRWLNEWALTETFIVSCAPYAAGANRPMLYLGKLLETFRQQGVTTPEAAADVHAAWREKQQPAQRQGKVVNEQQYAQREYTNTLDALDRMMAQWQEENGDAK